MITSQASRKELLAYALKNGFVPMAEDGIQKIIAGVIDLKELMRVVDMTDRMN
jgi:type II secretory ATPase GspE/PulE/Tfp pilus assembly ATPase PilB-like protein